MELNVVIHWLEFKRNLPRAPEPTKKRQWNQIYQLVCNTGIGIPCTLLYYVVFTAYLLDSEPECSFKK